MSIQWKNCFAAIVTMGAVLTIASLATPRKAFANALATLVQDVDQPARQPFQATVTVNLNNWATIPVAIPAGKRLVVEYIACSGGIISANNQVQPLIALTATQPAGTSTYYLHMLQSVAVPAQYAISQQIKLYADKLSVSFGMSGNMPNSFSAYVVISGHLIDIP